MCHDHIKSGFSLDEDLERVAAAARSENAAVREAASGDVMQPAPAALLPCGR